MKPISTIFLICCFQNLFAQWEQLPMPKGGRIDFLGTVNNLVWAKCSGRNYVSVDQGLSWQAWSIHDSLNEVRLWLNSNNLIATANRHVPWPYLNAKRKTIFKSSDNGSSWQALFSDTLLEYNVQSAFMAGDKLFFVGDGPGFGDFLYRSSDEGKTWDIVDVLGSGNSELHLDNVVSDGAVLVAGLWYDDDIGDAHFRQYRSADFGQTWQVLPQLPFNLEDYSIYVMQGCIVLRRANSQNPLWVSYDAGESFSQIPLDPERNRYYFAPLTNTLYAYDIDAISRFNPASQTWQSLTPPPQNFSTLIQTDAGTLLAGQNQFPGMYRKASSTQPWAVSNNGLQETVVSQLFTLDDHFYLRTESQCFASTNQTSSWQLMPVPAYYPAQIQRWGDTLVLSGLDSLYFSTDYGENWASSKQFFLPLNPNVQNYGDSLFVAINNVFENLRYTPDRGANWYGIDVPEQPGGIEMSDYYVGGGKIWATMSYSSGVYYSTNGGLDWSPSSVTDYYGKIVGEGSRLFLYGNKTLYSADGGDTWQPATGFPSGAKITILKKSSPGKWFAVVPEHGIYQSQDFGANWTLFDNPGLPEVLNVFPVDHHLYAYRYRSGLWRRPISVGVSNPVSTVSLQILPNPAHRQVSVMVNEKVQVEVLDMYGCVLCSDLVYPDTPKVLDIQQWPSGIYLVKASGTAAQIFLKL